MTAQVLCPALEAARQELLAKADILRPLVAPHALPFVDTAKATLEKLKCRIAIIGQVKAGKSSFVNALTGRPNFLPTNINPWTAAVTRLNFIDADAPNETAMTFRFFDVQDWDRLQNGSGYMRELTERLVPGFETELLRRNVEAMRQRAVARIGEDVEALLGQTHEYQAVSGDILAQYVCAGRPGATSAGGDGDEKNYSDIVHSAEINFQRPQEHFPAVFIDTPGTNDPFMVRDEITRRALEEVDVHIVVLMARQALSNADVALLRILRGLHKDRIIVFINRIDELGDVATMTPRVIEHVRSGLEREFPGTDIPIVAGSALWANEAGHKETGHKETGRGAGNGGAVDGFRSVGARYASSGMSELFDVLNEAIVRARPGHLLRQVAVSLKELAVLAAKEVEEERAAVAVTQEAPPANFDEAAHETLRNLIAEDARRSERLLEALAILLDDLEARFREVLVGACEALDESLRGDLLCYRDHECERLIDALSRGAQIGRWRAETTEVRRAFEKRVLHHYDAAADHLAFLTTAVCDQLEKLLREWSPDGPTRIDEQPASMRREPPVVSALGQFLVLDLSEPFWRRWLLARLPAEERVEQLDVMIKEEFGAIVDELVLAFEERLRELQAQYDLRLSLYQAMIVAAVEKRRHRAMSRLRQLEDVRDAWADSEKQRAIAENRGNELDDRADRLARLGAELERLAAEWSVRCEGQTVGAPEPGGS